MADENAATQLLKEQLAAELARLDVREGNLLDLAADDAMPVGRIRQKLRAITDQRDRIRERLGGVQDELSHGVRLVEACLQLLARPEQLYRQCNDEQRRLLNQALFTRIYVHHTRDIEVELREPFAALQDVHQSYGQGRDDAPPAHVAKATTAAADKKAAPTSGGGLLRAQLELLAKGMDPVQGCNTPYLVELTGFEPVASSMPWKRATNCAIAPTRSLGTSSDTNPIPSGYEIGPAGQAATCRLGAAASNAPGCTGRGSTTASRRSSHPTR